MARLFPPAWVALFVAYALGLVGALGDLPNSPSHEIQLFLADHFVRDWWGRFDARWYSGFDVTSVPVLAAQLAALLAKLPVLGLERAYAVVVALTGLVNGIGVVRLSSSVRRAETSGWLVAAAVAAPPSWVLLVPHGELPAALSIGLSLNALAWARGARQPLEWAATLALTAAAAACHPIGAAMTLASLPLVALGDAPRLGRMVAVLLGLVLGVIASWNVLEPILLRGEPSIGSTGGAMGQWLPLSAGIVALLVAIAGVIRRNASWLTAAVCSFLLLGLASLWSSNVAASAGLVVSLAALSGIEVAPRWPSFIVAALVFTLTAAWLGWARNLDTRSRRQALREVAWVLANVADGERHRFVTFGVGPEWIELSRRVRPGTIAGGVPGRAPIIDTATFDELQAALSDERNAIRWVVDGASSNRDQLAALGFVAVGAWRGNVTVWERASTPPVGPRAERVRSPWAVSILGPLLGVASLVVLALALVQLARRTETSEANEEDGFTLVSLD